MRGRTKEESACRKSVTRSKRQKKRYYQRKSLDERVNRNGSGKDYYYERYRRFFWLLDKVR